MMVDTQVYSTSYHTDQRLEWVKSQLELTQRCDIEYSYHADGSLQMSWCDDLYRNVVLLELDSYQVSLYELNTGERVSFNVYPYHFTPPVV